VGHHSPGAYGVITGKYKKLFPGLVVGSGFAVATPRDQLEFANGNPTFPPLRFNFTDDIRLIAREDGLISVNHAPRHRSDGQVGSESIGRACRRGRRADRFGIDHRWRAESRYRAAGDCDGKGRAGLAHYTSLAPAAVHLAANLRA